MCSDGPDSNEVHAETGEDEIKRKCSRVTFARFVEKMTALETLTGIPSEAPRYGGNCLRVWPSVTMVEAYPGATRRRLASPEEMKSQERLAIWKAEESGAVVDEQMG